MPLNARQKAHFRAAQRLLHDLGHEDPESFALAKPSRGNRRALYLSVERIFFEVLNLVQAALAGDQVHLGHTVLEHAVFNVMLGGSEDPVSDIVRSVRAQGLHHPGFVLYPLFGFGLLQTQGASLMALSRIEIIDGRAGIAVTSPLADNDVLLGFLERVITDLGIVGSVPRREMAHYVAMRGVTDWLLTNPLLLVRMRTVSMGARENQAVYLRAIEHRATLLGLVSALPKPRQTSRLLAGSTQAVNHGETLDFRHYFVFESPGVAELTLRAERVPMGPRRAPLVQVADLNIDVDPTSWSKPGVQRTVGALTQAMLDVEELQAAVAAGALTGRRKENVSRKLSTALHWCRRSFASFATPRESVVAMAVAFEALLSDGYSRGVTDRLQDRAAECLRMRRAPATLSAAVDQLFRWRGAIVHKGEAEARMDLRLARRAFAHCFIDVVRRVKLAVPETTLEIAHLFHADARPTEM